MKKIKIAPQPNLQEKLKFSRLVMVDNFAYISGTAPFDEDLNVVFPVSYTHLDVYKRQIITDVKRNP